MNNLERVLSLTHNETKFVYWVCREPDWSNEKIASAIGIKTTSIANYSRDAYRKLEVKASPRKMKEALAEQYSAEVASLYLNPGDFNKKEWEQIWAQKVNEKRAETPPTEPINETKEPIKEAEPPPRPPESRLPPIDKAYAPLPPPPPAPPPDPAIAKAETERRVQAGKRGQAAVFMGFGSFVSCCIASAIATGQEGEPTYWCAAPFTIAWLGLGVMAFIRWRQSRV